MFKKKNRKPEAVLTPDGFYVQLDAVRRLIKEAGKKFMDNRESDFNEYLQEMLDNGADINVRRAKKLFKAQGREFEILLDLIDSMLKSSEEATVKDENRVK